MRVCSDSAMMKKVKGISSFHHVFASGVSSLYICPASPNGVSTHQHRPANVDLVRQISISSEAEILKAYLPPIIANHYLINVFLHSC